MEKDKSDLAALLPEAIEDWKVTEKDRIYNRENLFDYINGGAELYISFGFESLVNRTYSRPQQPDIVVDLFDMSTSQNAFGVFSHGRESIDKTFGQGSQYIEGLLLFWKDRYYISILAHPETTESKQAILRLAGNIEEAIPTEGPLPEILTILPQQSLVKESIRYFHHHIWLNSHYYVADENILHIDERTDALLAKYGEIGKRHILLVVKYQNVEDADLGYHDFVKYYLPELAGKSAVQIEDGTWTGCQLTGNLLIIVFDAPTKETVIHLMEGVLKNK